MEIYQYKFDSDYFVNLEDVEEICKKMNITPWNTGITSTIFMSKNFDYWKVYVK